jgi:anti-sigma regulatory factor (Ser/Thr protein kinase)
LFAVQEAFTEIYPAAPESVARARSGVADYATLLGADAEELERIRLTVSEAVTNAVLHAYRGQPGTVQVTAASADGELWVLVADEGCGFQRPAARPGLGLGLALIADAADEFTIVERGGGGTEARMRFVLGARRSAA